MQKSNRKTITQKSRFNCISCGYEGFNSRREFSTNQPFLKKQTQFQRQNTEARRKNASSFVVGYYGEWKNKPNVNLGNLVQLL